MSNNYSIYVTYKFGSAPYSASTSLGYSDAIHCNYIQKIETDSVNNKDVSIYFNSVEDFIHMSEDTSNGLGWSATNLYVILQIVYGTGVPQPNLWRILDVTNQISGHTTNTIITPTQLINSVLKVPLGDITSYNLYNLDYLTYPTALTTDENKLSFGDESYFLGNVRTDIEAIAYTSDISISLNLNEFNSTTNPTWDEASPVQISEVGIYDDDGNLVAIGKINGSISKDSTVARTIVFAMDF